MKRFKRFSTIFIALMMAANLSLTTNVKAAGTNSTGESIVKYSKMFLGIPYLPKGTSQAGFDCSGFVQYIYAHFNVTLPRTTYDQVKTGTKIDRNNLKPGDLVFFGTASNVYHDGIYIGDGKFIHSPKSGDVIRVEYLAYMPDFYTGVRLI